MKKIILFMLVLMLTSTPSFAATYQLKVDHIDCEKCVQKIHDYFAKNLGARVQNLRIDMDADTVTFDSISVDTIEMENIQKGLSLLGFKVMPLKNLNELMTKGTISFYFLSPSSFSL